MTCRRTHSGPSAMLYVFEDNEAVIKMIIKGRSPTMEMEMDSHGGLEVTIRQTESKKKLPNNFVKQTPECS